MVHRPASYDMDHGQEVAHETGYRRTVDDTVFELVTTRERSVIYRNEEEYLTFPYGVRVVLGRGGQLLKLIGMSVRQIEGVCAMRARRSRSPSRATSNLNMRTAVS